MAKNETLATADIPIKSVANQMHESGISSIFDFLNIKIKIK